MEIETEYSVVITTTQGAEVAEALAKGILQERLGACVQIQQIKSLYNWKGEVCTEPECLLMIKTQTSLFADLQNYIKSHHTYETPEIIMLPVSAGSLEYLSWIAKETRV